MTGTTARGTQGQADKEPTKTPSTRLDVETPTPEGAKTAITSPSRKVQSPQHTKESTSIQRQIITKHRNPTSRRSRPLASINPSQSTETTPTSPRSRLPILDIFVTNCHQVQNSNITPWPPPVDCKARRIHNTDVTSRRCRTNATKPSRHQLPSNHKTRTHEGNTTRWREKRHARKKRCRANRDKPEEGHVNQVNAFIKDFEEEGTALEEP